MRTFGHDRGFQLLLSALLLTLSVSMIAPMLHLAAVSLSSLEAVNARKVVFWPIGFNLDVYQTIIGMERLWRALGVTVYITVVGTAVCLFLTSTLSYALSRPNMKGRKYVLQGLVLTFIFSAPLIPTYMVVKSLGMENTLWALIIPGAIGAFYVIIMKTFFQGISQEIFDAGKIDGCSEYRLYYRIVLPLSKPVLATIALFHAVGQWNSYFSALVFIRSIELKPLQIVLRDLIVDTDVEQLTKAGFDTLQQTPEMMKAGVTLFATVPILIVYPFLQKYFVKGAMLGSLKE